MSGQTTLVWSLRRAYACDQAIIRLDMALAGAYIDVERFGAAIDADPNNKAAAREYTRAQERAARIQESQRCLTKRNFVYPAYH